MPCKNPCRLYIHLTFTYSIGPSSVVGSELGPAPAFPPMRVLEVQWSWALSHGRVHNVFRFGVLQCSTKLWMLLSFGWDVYFGCFVMLGMAS